MVMQPEDPIEGPVSAEFSPAGGSGCVLLTVDEQTPLCRVSDMLPSTGHSLLMVTNEERQVVGIVSSHEVGQRLRTGHEQERNRWRQMPIGALMPVRIPAVFRSIGWLPVESSDRAGQPPEEMSAFISERDVYISWRSLAPELREAFRDRLTGLPNRAGLEFRLIPDWRRALAIHQTLAILVIDLDHFKQVNDNCGHLFADGVLQEVANALKQSLRSYDAVARYGGDEFVAICVGCSPEEVALPIGRMYNAFQDISFDVGGHLSVSASVGVAVCRPGVNCDSETDLLRAADDCLYAAKQHRRGSAFAIDFTSGDSSRHSPQMIPQFSESACSA